MINKNSYLTVTDQFCGAGGSSQGVRLAAKKKNIGNGIEVKLALNHWKLAIETHNTNFPDTDHVCCNVSNVDPRRFMSTDILITSPECTVHSPAGGGQSKKKMYGNQLALSGKLASEEAEERSRMTMWDVCTWAEYHKYNIVIVENVIEARTKWSLFDVWLQAMVKLGYDYQIKYINSMHAHPTPQSRDRMFVVFSKKGNKKPDLNFTPSAFCDKCCKNVDAYQWWKPKPRNSKNPAEHGKYKTQYLFKCPECHSIVEPYFYAAFNCIDWSKPGARIGDRKSPLKPKTLSRCQYGVDKYWDQPTFINVKFSSGVDFRVKPVSEEPLATQPGEAAMGILKPQIISGRYIQGISNRVRNSDEALPVQVTDGRESVFFPPAALISINYDGIDRRVRNSDEPLPAQTGQEERAIMMPPIIASRQGYGNRARNSNDPLPTQLGDGHDSVLFSPLVIDSGWSENKPRIDQADKEALSTQDTGQTKGVILPFLIKNYGGDPQKPVRGEEPLGAITGQDHHGLVNMPLVTELNSSGKAKPVDETLSTVTAGGNHHGLLNTPLIVENHGQSMSRPATERLSTITGIHKQGIITDESFNSFISYYYKSSQASHITEAIRTISTKDRAYLINQPYEKPKLEDCYYRMLLPHEIQLGMAFDKDYVVLGNSKQKVKQLGNAVTPPVMQFLIERCIDSLQ